jgi:hypothetical protein
MKYSAFYKMRGDSVTLNQPMVPCDLSIGSWLYSQRYATDIAGGTGVDCSIRLPPEIESMRPDYSLYGLDYSLGYTWSYCPRNCPFCVVGKQANPKTHHSIWEFHDSRFKKICLLNNNTFTDPQWHDTFQEIWDAKAVVIDENGYDCRLLDEEKAEALKRTKFEGSIHFAWDLMKDEAKVLQGLEIARKAHLRAVVYVLVGFNTTIVEDIYRCQKIHDLKLDPYVMPYKLAGRRASKETRAFKRFIDFRYYRKHKTIQEAWEAYK